MHNLKKWDMINEALKDSYSNSMYNMLFLDMTPLYLTNEEVILNVNEVGYTFLQDIDTMNFKKLMYIIKAHTSPDVKIRIVSESENLHQESINEIEEEDSLLEKIPSMYFSKSKPQENIKFITKKEEKEKIDIKEDYLNNEINLEEASNVFSNDLIMEPNKFLNKKTFLNNTSELKNQFETNLKSNLNFDNFFYSFENKKVVKACSVIIETIENPKFNPLFIYGHSGIGKTHLINAVGNEVLRKKPEKKVLYVTATKFLEEYTNLFKGGINNLDASDFFKEKYYSVDVLIFDDIQILEGKESTLNEFFSIFEQLMFNEKMIIITSDKHPEEINFEERLISRFLSGLTLELRVPDSDTKKQIFNHHAMKENFKVTEKAMQIFIEKSQNVRALLGYIGAMILYSINGDVQEGFFDVEHAQEIVNEQSSNENNMSAQDIIEIVVNHFEIEKKDLQLRSRKQPIVKSRQFIAYFLHERLKMNYVDIARHIGVKEHSTALRGVKKIKNERNHLKYKDDFLKLSKIINK